jgi:hypothetical protein
MRAARGMLLLVAVALIGCMTTRARTAAAADNLEHSIGVFAQHACESGDAQCATGEYVPARLLQEQTKEFHRALDHAGDQDVIAAYKQLWHAYHKVRDDIYRSPDRQLRSDFERVSHAFSDVEVNVKNGYSHADPTLYSSGGYKFDPYYN